MSATSAPRVDDGQEVLFEEQRVAPFAEAGLAGFIVAAAAAVSVASPILTPLLLALGASLLVGGRRCARERWIERYRLTDDAIEVEERQTAGTVRVPIDRLASVEAAGRRVTFRLDDGHTLRLGHVRGSRRLLKMLRERFPQLEIVERIDLSCPT